MAAAKQGLLKPPAFQYVGELTLADIGLGPRLEAEAQIWTDVADPSLVAGILPARPLEAHKGTFGTAMIVAGSVNYTGAALLAGKAAYRLGAGLVNMAVPTSLHTALAGHFPEATWLLLPQELGVISRDAAAVVRKHLGRATGMLVGPGLGTEDTTAEFLGQLVGPHSATRSAGANIGFVRDQNRPDVSPSGTLPPLVIDADGLRLLGRIKGWPGLLPAPAVLTPHPGEMSALTGLRTEAILGDRQEMAVKFAREWGHVVVLKGAFTAVAAPDGRSTIIPVATAALASAGTGDVLAGAIVGLRAQGVPAYEAAVAAAWIHGRAGILASRRLGSSTPVIAGDVLESLSEVLAGLR
jgi:NAD(P)H-hydrate epimerase